MNRFLLLIFLTTILSLNCKDKADSNLGLKKSPVEKQDTANGIRMALPAFPADKMQLLYEKCDYADYIFHNLPFSISQAEKPAILKNLGFISSEPGGDVVLTCKPMGREFFHINGEIVFEADIYFEDGCQYIVFMDGNDPVYLNEISESGKQFYTNIIAQTFNK